MVVPTTGGLEQRWCYIDFSTATTTTATRRGVTSNHQKYYVLLE